ncbi:hypothetical protein BVL41_10730 [Corynebacterium diphtheriae]|nr:hypothetical protein BVL41_10730 [Corynebacterium diphtheriae]
MRPVRRGFGRGWLGWDWWALVGSPPPFTPEKDRTSHQICSNGRIGSDLCEVRRKILRNTPV